VQIAGNNALHHEFFGGDFQFCQGYGIRCDSGSIEVYGSSFQNQLFDFGHSPQATQLSLDTYDILANGPGGANQAAGVHNLRSEGNKALKSTQGGAVVYGYTLSGLDSLQDWTATNGQRQGDTIFPTTNNSQHREFICVDAGGPDNKWQMVDASSIIGPDTIKITPSPSYTVNALIGKELWFRFGSNGFTERLTIDSNTANTITSNGSNIGNDAAADTLIFVSGFTGGSAPNFNSAAAGTFVQEGVTSQGFGTTAGSAQITVGTGIAAALSVGNYVFIPEADQIGVFSDTNAIQVKWPLIAKVVSDDGASGGVHLFTVDKKAKFTLGLGGGGSTGVRGVFGASITDGDVKWINFPYYAYYGVNILENAQTPTGARWRNIDYVRSSDIELSNSSELVPIDTDNADGNVVNQNQFTNITKGAIWQANNVSISTATPIDVTGYLRMGDVWNLTPTQNQTLQQTGTLVDFLTQEITLGITTSGTTSFTITFGTGFRTTGPLATGTVDSKVFIIKFIAVQGLLFETSRIGPL
jgi:hypothetical protein